MSTNPTILLSSVAFIFGIIFVTIIKSFSGGFYDNTFLEIPYPIAYLFVPLATGSLTYISAQYISKYRPFIIGSYKGNFVITLMAFYLYGLLHAVAVGVTNSYMLAPTILIAFVIFGSIVVLPVCVILALLSTCIYNKFKHSKS